MLTLGIHCAGAYCDVALADETGSVGVMREAMKRGHDQKLAGLTADLLTSKSVRMSDIERFAVCVGPGSFTGIRVGVAFARGLALAGGTSAIGVTSLEAMLPAAKAQPAIAFLPAKQRPPDLSFWVQGLGTDLFSEPVELSESDLNNTIPPDALLVVPADIHTVLEDYLPGERNIQNAESSAANVASLAASLPAGPHRNANPLYVRAPDAIPAKPIATILSD